MEDYDLYNYSNDEKIKITDLSLLKITKVRENDGLYGFNIYFDYDNNHYFIHSYEDWHRVNVLFEKKYCDDGRYKIFLLNYTRICWELEEYLLDYKGEPWNKKRPKKKKRPPYKQIDKEHFVNKLMEQGLCSYYEETK